MQSMNIFKLLKINIKIVAHNIDIYKQNDHVQTISVTFKSK